MADVIDNQEPTMPDNLEHWQVLEVQMYGCTEAQLRVSVTQIMEQRQIGPALYAAMVISEAQQLLSEGPWDGDTLANIIEDQRKMLNRAKWVIWQYWKDLS